ncbi:transcriptional regulator, TetR family [Chloroherpeton thalassium ATCC 35110]|uniref:Transcriptional regulator, TetR family n=1 Tax=Chloroherpeton thalassium (strain ATCC 35110 / GB-78) TaxID=517418 RepID=B3QZ89_CHLT3|nr:TetR/AcrR family transcriptional regulator [Chloroherpeton thalassium]ACF13782.1 transcriptional regulator, TetR family [Chloroherpeton thalassium ATCC 35110]
MENEGATEERIFSAARTVFQKRGFNGTRMQDIADEAGINKALLHYYYRSKDNLFEAVLNEALTRIGPKLFAYLEDDIPLEEKVEKFVVNYIETVSKHPFIPGFIMHEIHTNRERLTRFLSTQVRAFIKLDKVREQLDEGIRDGKYREISAEQFFIHIFSLCAFPFAARPTLQAILSLDDATYQNILDERKKEIPKLILNAIKK